MSLYEKIKQIHPSLTDADFEPITGTIMLQNDSDGKGDYIKEWNHPTLTKLAQEQLDGIN